MHVIQENLAGRVHALLMVLAKMPARARGTRASRLKPLRYLLPNILTSCMPSDPAGYDMEDAMILNKSAVDRGLAHGTLFKTEALDLRDDKGKFMVGTHSPLLFSATG